MAIRLAAYAGGIRACRLCLDQPAGKPLPHTPRPVLVESSTARILVAGQAPGTRVHASGVPFTDRSGERLRGWMGVTEAEFYEADRIAIAPMGFCFPGQDAKGSDLPPRRECAATWRQGLIALMPQVDLVLAIGRHAQAWHLRLPRRATLAATVGEWERILAQGTGPAVIPLPHPSWRNTAWLKRNPWFQEELLPVLQKHVRSRMVP